MARGGCMDSRLRRLDACARGASTFEGGLAEAEPAPASAAIANLLPGATGQVARFLPGPGHRSLRAVVAKT